MVATAAETARRTARDLGARPWRPSVATTTGHSSRARRVVVLAGPAAMMNTHRMACPGWRRPGRPASAPFGDPERVQPVGAGGWHQLIDQVIGGHAQLTQVIRQRNPKNREVGAAIRDGHAHQALANLRARGRLHLAPARSAAIRVVGRAPRLRHLRPSRWLSGTLAVLAAAWLAVLIVPSTPWALLELPVLVGSRLLAQRHLRRRPPDLDPALAILDPPSPGRGWGRWRPWR